MNRLPFRALAVLPSPSSVAQITAQRGARKLVRVKNYEELPPGIEIHNDRASSVGVLLRRDPVILPEPTPFEAAYAAHVDELRLEAARPLASDFFFKKGTNDEQLFREAQRLEREGASRSGSASVDSKTDSEGDNNEASAKSATENPFAAYDGPLAPRTSEADANGDITTLSRAFDKPVFLVVRKKGEESVWKFPESPVKSTELLHEAADRFLKEDFSMLDTWVVGRVPIGFYTYVYTDRVQRSAARNTAANVFFMKAHVMSGQIQALKDNRYEHAWLTKEELQKLTDPSYFLAVKDMI